LSNQALRSEDMLLVYQFRHWIKQLCLAIECEHRKQKEDRSLKLYRGFQLHKEEFERLKKSIGNLISINSFLSTTHDIDVARVFAGEGITEGSLVSVLLQIEANPARLQSVFFADISHMSQFSEEKEVLFSLGSTFRIHSIDFDDNLKQWIVQLNATDDGSDRIHEYCQLANYNFHSTSPMIYFGRILNENLDQIDRSIRYFRELLKLVGNNHRDSSEIYDALGDAYARRNEISESIKCYKIERKIQKKQGILPNNTNEKILRMKLTEEENKTNEPNLNKADLLCQLAEYTNYAQAEIYCNQALQIYEQLNLASPSMSACMEQLAWIYTMNHKYQKRLDLHYRRLTIEEEYLPIDNQKLCETLKDIMNDGKTPDDHRRFIKFCQTKMPILRQNLGENHHRLVQMQKCLDKVQYQLNDFEDEQIDWINHLQTINEKDLNQRIQFYDDISRFYFRHGLFNESLQYSFNQLEICQNIHQYQPMKIIEIFDQISLCYKEMFNYPQAFVYMKKKFEFAQSIQHIDPKIVDDIQNRIDNFVRHAARHEIELPWIPTSQEDPDTPW
jgi:tetratricopeptide (TPR) repeat protein